MAFKDGHTKTGGRASGVKNRGTETKERITGMVTSRFDDFMESFDKLPPAKKCDLFLKLVEFVLPKMSSVKFEEESASTSAAELLRERSRYEDKEQ